MISLLNNYRLLVEKVDAFCSRLTGQFTAHLSCRPGCEGCCRHLTLFPIEAAALQNALHSLPSQQQEAIRERARASTPTSPCPLLSNGLCDLYAARPIICRTHGFPVITGEGENRRVDYCSLNFQEIRQLPGGSVLDLDRLNETLVTVNALFVAQSGWRGSDERLWISDVLVAEQEENQEKA